QVDIQPLRDRGSRRARVDQRRIADALADYYGIRPAPYGTYSATYDDSVATTSILTQPDWLDLACPLVAANDRISVVRTAEDDITPLSEDAADRAVQRLAETLAMGTRLVDMPLYRMLDIDVRKGRIGGQAGLSRFVGYAVTMDLLENELVDTLAT